MPGIKRRKGVGALHNNEEEKITYCERCLELANVRSILKTRVYLPDENGKTPVIPEDHDKWRQCHRCGSVYPRYNVKQESKLVDVVEPLHNPHDSGRGVIKSVGETRKFDRTGMRQYKKKSKQELSYIKDEDLKKDLEAGCQLISYEDNSSSVY